MSRVAKNPIVIPKSVTININGQEISVKGAKGAMQHAVPITVGIIFEENHLHFEARDASREANALAGSTRAVLNNMVKGVAEGFECKLELHGVGYRAQVQGSKLNLTLGFSHPVEFHAPKGITLETPSQTEVVIKGADRQLVGQVAANIRAYRPPEPYKGKGVRYAGEKIILKETKKK
jgi:large subunit ribosomal protein L6